MMSSENPFADVQPDAVLRWAQALRESLRDSLTSATKRRRKFNGLIYLGLLERELNPHQVPPESEAQFHAPIEVREALADLRDLCYRFADHLGWSEMWNGRPMAVPPPLELPELPGQLTAKLTDALERLEAGLKSTTTVAPTGPHRPQSFPPSSRPTCENPNGGP